MADHHSPVDDDTLDPGERVGHNIPLDDSLSLLQMLAQQPADPLASSDERFRSSMSGSMQIPLNDDPLQTAQNYLNEIEALLTQKRLLDDQLMMEDVDASVKRNAIASLDKRLVDLIAKLLSMNSILEPHTVALTNNYIMVVLPELPEQDQIYLRNILAAEYHVGYQQVPHIQHSISGYGYTPGQMHLHQYSDVNEDQYQSVSMMPHQVQSDNNLNRTGHIYAPQPPTPTQTAPDPAVIENLLHELSPLMSTNTMTQPSQPQTPLQHHHPLQPQIPLSPAFELSPLSPQLRYEDIKAPDVSSTTKKDKKARKKRKAQGESEDVSKPKKPKPQEAPGGVVTIASIQKPFSVSSTMKAHSLRIGSFYAERDANTDIVVKFYYSKKQFVWTLLDTSTKLSKKMVIPFCDVDGLEFKTRTDTPAHLQVMALKLNAIPKFYTETPDPKFKHNKCWTKVDDWTRDGSEPLSTTQELEFDDGTLTQRSAGVSHYDKLVIGDPYLRSVTKTSDGTFGEPGAGLTVNGLSDFNDLKARVIKFFKNVETYIKESGWPAYSHCINKTVAHKFKFKGSDKPESSIALNLDDLLNLMKQRNEEVMSKDEIHYFVGITKIAENGISLFKIPSAVKQIPSPPLMPSPPMSPNILGVPCHPSSGLGDDLLRGNSTAALLSQALTQATDSGVTSSKGDEEEGAAVIAERLQDLLAAHTAQVDSIGIDPSKASILGGEPPVEEKPKKKKKKSKKDAADSGGASNPSFSKKPSPEGPKPIRVACIFSKERMAIVLGAEVVEFWADDPTGAHGANSGTNHSNLLNATSASNNFGHHSAPRSPRSPRSPNGGTLFKSE